MNAVIINGENKTVAEKTVSELLRALDYQSEKVAVAINGEFLPRSQYASKAIAENDAIEVLSAVQGG